MSMGKPIDVISDPGHFLVHADRVIQASNISAATKVEWVTYHVGKLAEYSEAGLDLEHIQCLAKLGAALWPIQEQQAREEQRERAIAIAQQAAEEQAQAEEWKRLWTEQLRAVEIARQAERDRVAEGLELAREANIRLNRAVDKWSKPRAQWFRMVQSLRRGRFEDHAYQGAD